MKKSNKFPQILKNYMNILKKFQEQKVINNKDY